MRLIPTLVLSAAALAGAACLVRSAGAQDRGGEPVAAAAPSADTLRDVEVMRRVLVREGLKSGAAGGGSYAYWVGASALTSAGGSSEAYLVAGDGATFLLRTSDPVAPGPASDRTAAETKQPSAWDEAEAEMEGRPRRTPVARVAGELPRYDAAKVEALRLRLLDQLATYGSRIRGLAPADRITVIVTGSGMQHLTTVAPSPETGGVAESAGRLLRDVYLVSAAAARPTVLTLRVSVADCQSFAAGSLDAEGFRRRAVISAY